MTELNQPVDPQSTYRSILQHQLSVLIKDPSRVFLVERQLQQAADQYAADAANDSRRNTIIERPRESGPAPVHARTALGDRESLAWLEQTVRVRLGELAVPLSGVGRVLIEQVPGFDQFTVKWFRSSSGSERASLTLPGQEIAQVRIAEKVAVLEWADTVARNLILIRDGAGDPGPDGPQFPG